MRFKLIIIEDSGSCYKSELAKEVIKKVLCKDMNITYIEAKGQKKSQCENDIIVTRKSNGGICNVNIADKFIIENEIEGQKIIGNNCIATLIEHNCISNVNMEDFKEIQKLLKTKNICFLCHGRSKWGYHKKCVFAKGENYYVSQISVIKHTKMINELKQKHLLFYVKGLFSGVSFIRDAMRYGYINRKTITALKEMCEEYQFILANKNKLLSLKNNRIIDTIKKQRRKPSLKQRLMIEKIIKDFDRIKKIDENYKDDKNYQKYGYSYADK